MTHTLHPEIKSKLLNIITIMDGQFRSGNMQASEKTRLWDILMDKLGPYLLPPSQHLKDEPLPKDGDIRFNDDGLGTYIVDHEIKKMEWIPESNCRIHKFIA